MFDNFENYINKELYIKALHTLETALKLSTNLAEQVSELKKKNESLQCKIDQLMIEFCPEEMDKEQFDNWAKNQVPSPNNEAIDLS